MKHTTHDLREDEKQKIFYKFFEIVQLIYCLNSMILRKQLIQIYHMMFNVDKKKVEFMIAELIQKGFILQKKIEGSTKTMCLYLSKWPRSQFNAHKETKDMEVLTFSKNKILKHVFTINFLIQTVIPILKTGNSVVTTETLMDYLDSIGTNLLLKNSQCDNPKFYKNFETNCSLCSIKLSDEFYRDYEISRYDRQRFQMSHRKEKLMPEPCEAKDTRLADMAKCKTDIERNKQFYSLNNFSGNNFIYAGYDPNENKFYTAYFDHMNSIQTKKLWTNICFIYCMLQRYTGIMDFNLHIDLFVWDSDRKAQLEKDFESQAYDFYKQEWCGETKVHKVMQDIGILPSHRKNFSFDIKINSVFENYNISLT